MRWVIFICVLGAAACVGRGELAFAPTADGATIHDVWVVNFRADQEPAEGQRSPPRPNDVKFEKYIVSVPPTHTPGLITWPDGPPDAATDFVTVDSTTFDSRNSFRSAILQDNAQHPEVLLFVHGYNTNHAEALYLSTQVRHDFEIESPSILFSWPSAEVTAGYLYDRDSALIARDHLEDVIVALAEERQVVLMGHSMGNFLIMETLRQIELTGSLDISRDISALFMFSPDIDGELFGVQARRLEQFPEPTVIFAAEKDKALRISALLTGRTNRLGSDVNRVAVGDLPIALIDVSAFTDGGLDHNVALQSPAAIAVLTNMTRDKLPSQSPSQSRTIKLLPSLGN